MLRIVLRSVDDRKRHPGARVVECEQPELGRQAALVIVEEVPHDLHPRELERGEVPAQDVEVATERRVRLEVDARLEARLPGPLGLQPVFDRGQDLVVLERETGDVGGAQEGKLARLHGRSRAQGLRLNGRDLTAEDVVRVARHGAPVELDPAALARMAAAREVVERYLADGRPAYGLTTGLGARAVESIPVSGLADFSRHTVLGRANSVGPPLRTEVVRAALLVRANGLAHGGSGATPELAQALVALLEHGVHPLVPSIGSIGAGDRFTGAPLKITAA